MSIFNRKKEEEYFDDLEEKDVKDDLVDKKFRKKVKDLKPENKKKRKEPPKPWGKKERMIVLIVFLSVTLISGIMALSSQHKGGYFQINFPELSFRFDFSKLNLFKEETIEINRK